MRKLRSQEQIMQRWKGDVSHPLISIFCLAYNHEAYIEDALEGLLIQDTDFPFEIIIHDDASTDKTAEIIREYEKCYPAIIKPIYQTVNQYSQGIKAFFIYGRDCKGRYVALCEGDDYWIDSHKLQIQIDFLEANPSYVISTHDTCIVDDKNKIVQKSRFLERQKRDFTQQELMLGKTWIPTPWLFRNIIAEIPPECKFVLNGDVFLSSFFGKFGKSKFHFDIQPSCYRVHNGGVWSMISSIDRRNECINTAFWLYRYYLRTGDKACADHFFASYISQVLSCVGIFRLIREICFKLLRKINTSLKITQKYKEFLKLVKKKT